MVSEDGIAGYARETVHETCRLDDVSDTDYGRTSQYGLTIENVVVSFLLHLGAQSRRNRCVRGVIGHSPITPLRSLATHDEAASLRGFPLNLALAFL